MRASLTPASVRTRPSPISRTLSALRRGSWATPGPTGPPCAGSSSRPRPRSPSWRPSRRASRGVPAERLDAYTLELQRHGLDACEREVRWLEELIALHEAGHAIVGIVACPEDRLHKVTIEPRGRSLGAAHFAPEGDRHLYPRHYLEGVIAKALGGRAAELVFLGADRVTSGAGADLVQATSIARRARPATRGAKAA